MPHARNALSAVLVAAALLPTSGFAQAAAGTGKGPWILTCDMESAPGAHRPMAQRVFRLAPKLFQEWRPDMKSWGYNLCSSFPCAADTAAVEGVISSPTLVLTIRLDRKTGAGSWSTQGASGLTRSSGACTVEPEATAKPPR